MKTNTYDVTVFGAGVSGICAAIQSARGGAKTLLIEKSGLIGGAITLAGVVEPAMFNAWGRQIISGIGWELIAKTLTECGQKVPDVASRETRDHCGSAVKIDPLFFSLISEENLISAGVVEALHTMPFRLECGDDAWHISLIGKEGAYAIDSRFVIDCTGDADLIRLAGGRMLEQSEWQPGTINFRIDGFDAENIDYDALGAALLRAYNAGEMEHGDIWWCGDHLPEKAADCGNLFRYFLKRRGVNANHVTMYSPAVPGSRSRFEQEGRAALLRTWRFLRRQPGFEKITFTPVAPECGVRESFRMAGKTVVTQEDYLNGRHFEDAVCFSFYPIDLHDEKCGLRVRPLPDGALPTVPRRALIPESLPRMLAAGRIISSDREANSALRIQATCMATGQAAGALAALAGSTGSADAETVPMEALRALLTANGAIVP